MCDAGTYKAGNGTGVCAACPKGTSSPLQGATSNDSCVACVAGTFAKAGAALCSPCPGLSVSGAGASSCSSDVKAVQSAAVVVGDLSSFVAKEQEYLDSYAAAAGLDSSLVSTLSMEQIQVRSQSYALNPQPSTLNPKA